MKRYKMIVGYDGTNYNGFAIQPNGITIQGILNESIAKIVQHEVRTLGAGRTDAGVHAKGQCCIFDSDTKIPVYKLGLAINSQLPKDIAVKTIEEVSMDFQPRFGAKRKTYRYQIINSSIRDPFLYKYAMSYPHKLDIELMKKAAYEIVGEHDFACFCSSGSTVKDTVRTIYSIDIKKEEDLITIDICGNGFLYNMVRIIVGTLLRVNEDKITIEDIGKLIESKDRNLAGPTAPPQGLMMMNIVYDDVSIDK